MGLEQLRALSPMDEYNKLSWASLANMQPEQHQAYATQQEDYMRLSDLYNKNAVERMHPEQLREASLRNVGLDYENQQKEYLMPTHQLAGSLAQDKLNSPSYRSNESMLDEATQKTKIAEQTNANRRAVAENRAGAFEPQAQFAAGEARFKLQQQPITQATAAAVNQTAGNGAKLEQAFSKLNSLDPKTISSEQYLGLVNEYYKDDPATLQKLTDMGRTQGGRTEVIEKYAAKINKALSANWDNSLEGRKAAADLAKTLAGLSVNAAAIMQVAMGYALADHRIKPNEADIDRARTAIIQQTTSSQGVSFDANGNPVLRTDKGPIGPKVQAPVASTVQAASTVPVASTGAVTYGDVMSQLSRKNQDIVHSKYEGSVQKFGTSNPVDYTMALQAAQATKTQQTGTKQSGAAVEVTPSAIAAERARRQQGK